MPPNTHKTTMRILQTQTKQLPGNIDPNPNPSWLRHCNHLALTCHKLEHEVEKNK